MNRIVSLLCFGFTACVEKPVSLQKNSTSQLVEPTNPQKTKTSSPESTGLLESSLRDQCCSQCGDAAGKDPTGTDISMKSCLAYSGTMINDMPLLTAACTNFFQSRMLTVADCR